MNRKLIQRKNIFLGITFKGISIFLNFIIVPILILFLGKAEYGIWVTIFSITNWIFTFDLGIGQGLRNKLTESLTIRDFKTSKEVISNSYIFISIFSLLIFFLGLIYIYFIDFQTLLNYSFKTNTYLRDFVVLSFFFTILNFILSLYKKLYLAVHRSYIVELSNVFFQFFYLTLILIWDYLDYEKTLISLSIIYGLINLSVSLFATFIFFKLRKKLSFSFKNFNLKKSKELFSIGGRFFIINICLLIILSTDNIIISKILGPTFVTDYSIIQKIFQFIIVLFTVVLSTSWSLYSEAIINKDYGWIRSNIKKMNLYLILAMFIGVILFIYIDEILNIWIGKDIVLIPKGLAFLNMIYVFAFCFTNIYMFFINASNKINIQMYLYLFGAIINIPLSIFFVDLIGTSTGVMLATIISFLPLFFVMPLQTKYLLNKYELK